VSEDSGQNGINWYAYTDDNPVNRIDQNGKWWVFVGILLSGLINGFLTWMGGGNFGIGFLTGLLSGVAVALGPVAGVIGGAIAAALNAWLNGGSAKTVFAAAVIGAIGGGILGKVNALSEGHQLEVMFELLLGADVGLIQGDINLGIQLFG
jgi:hypothetical protein